MSDLIDYLAQKRSAWLERRQRIAAGSLGPAALKARAIAEGLALGRRDRFAVGRCAADRQRVEIERGRAGQRETAARRERERRGETQRAGAGEEGASVAVRLGHVNSCNVQLSASRPPLRKMESFCGEWTRAHNTSR